MSRLAVVVAGGLIALPLTVAGAAAAQPGDGPLVHTTCSYDQLYAAIRVEAPRAATEFDNRAAAQQKLQNFAAMSVEARMQERARLLAENPHWQAKINEKRGTPEGQDKVQRLTRIAETCHTY